MNTLILDFLNSYADNPNPQYAVMLKGKWGCGKTHLIKQWKKRFDETADTDEEITLKPIYISTYGMDSVNDIKTAIDRELNPFFYSKTGRFIKGILKLAGKVVFKTSVDFNDNSKEDGSFSATLDSLSLLQVEDDSIKGVKFLIFDDIERCLIEMKELLGFINYFVEHCNCHVVVIGDENHLEELPKAVLGEFKEKTIGKEFEIQPDIEEAIEYFLDEVPVSDYLKVNAMAIYNYGIGGNEVKVDANESIAEIPSNRTLIVQKLTDEAPAAPESVYGLETIEDVFQRFEPTVDLRHVDAEGNEIKEIMTFTGLGDFGAKKIKEKSDFLSKLDIEKEQGVRITRQLTSNRALQKALENPEVKNAIMDVIESSIEEILANQKKVEL